MMHGTPLKRGIIARTAALAAAAALTAGLAACGGDDPVGARSPQPIRLGAVYDLTGSQSSLDTPSLEGARLAVDRINAAGGLLGRRVELIERDGRTDQTTVARVTRELVAAGVVTVIGLSDTGQVLAAAPVTAQSGIPFITSGATSPLLPDKVPGWLFLACFGDNQQAAAAAEYAAGTLGAKHAAIVYDKRMAYTRLLARYFSSGFRAAGGLISSTVGYGSGDRDVAKLVARAQRSPTGRLPDEEKTDEAGGGGSRSGSGSEDSAASDDATGGDASPDPSPDAEPSAGPATASPDPDEAGSGDSSGASEDGDGGSSGGDSSSGGGTARPDPDVIFIAAGPDDAARLVLTLRAAGYTQPIVGGDSFDVPSLRSAAEDSGGGVFYTTHGAVGLDGASRRLRVFSRRYAAAYGAPPQNAFACLGYDAVQLVAAAIRTAESSEPDTIRDTLQSTRLFIGVTGPFRYRGGTGVPDKQVTIVRVNRRAELADVVRPRLVPRP